MTSDLGEGGALAPSTWSTLEPKVRSAPLNCFGSRLLLRGRMRSKRTTGITAAMVRQFAVMIALVLFAVGPVAECLICEPEVVSVEATGAAHVQDSAAFDASHDADGSTPTRDALCVHGHCHHGGAALGELAIAVANPMLRARPLNPVFDTSAGPSAAHLRLDRPPRA